MSPRRATWHLRATEKTPIRQFQGFVQDHGFVYQRGDVAHYNKRLVFTRGDQQITADFAGTHFGCAWLHASENHRGKLITDPALIEQFVTESQEWAIEHADEWESQDEGSVVERQLVRERAARGIAS